MNYRKGSFAEPIHPKGYKKPKSRLKVGRSPVYVPTSTDGQLNAAKWLRR